MLEIDIFEIVLKQVSCLLWFQKLKGNPVDSRLLESTKHSLIRSSWCHCQYTSHVGDRLYAH